MKGYTKWIVAFVLTLVPTICFGDDWGSSPLWDMFKNLSFDPPGGDMSVAFLAKMFGTVPGVPQLAGAGQTIVGVVFGMFNSGILALSGVFLSYTITKILTETTMDGAAMGKSTTIWTAVRCALSTSLLVPQASGYSMVNGIVMWVVIQGVGLADYTWTNAMEYLKKGGNVYAPPASIVDYSLINYGVKAGKKAIDDTNKEKCVGSTDILRSLTCSYVALEALKYRQSLNKSYLDNLKKQRSLTADEQTQYYKASIPLPEKSEGGFSIYYNDADAGVFKFPYIKGEANNTFAADYGLKDSSNIPKNLTGVCGKIKYASDVDRYTEGKQSGLSNMIGILEPIAKQIVNKIKLDGEKRELDPDTYAVYKDSISTEHKFLQEPNAKPKDYTKQIISNLQEMGVSKLPSINWPFGSDEILRAALTYQIILAPVQLEGSNALGKKQKEEFDNAKKQGWITAGNYYRLLAAQQANVISEYDKYRLVGDEFGENNDGSGERASRVYMSLIKNASKDTIDQVWTDKGDRDLLEKTLLWIYLSYPYSKFHGEVLNLGKTALGDTATGVTGPSLSGFGVMPLFQTEAVTWAKVAVGAVFLVTMPAVSIPILLNIPMDFLYVDVNNIMEDWNDNMGSASADKDPIIKLQNLGNSMIKNALAYAKQLQIYFGVLAGATTVASMIMNLVAWSSAPVSFWSIGLGITVAAGVSTEFYNSMIDLVQTIIFMQLPVAIAVLGPIFISGIVFSIYVPLIPYLLFLFGAISWFISVLVLMAAAPIICFLMLWGNSSQENPLLAREAEQFVMQVIAVFFRPILMIIGLVAGMVLSYIGVDLLNLGFAKIMDIVVVNKSGTMQLIQQVGGIVVYTFTMVSVVNMCFSTIHLLYSEAMRVAGITAPVAGMEEKHMEAVKGAVTQFAEAGAGGLKEGATSLKGAGVRAKGKGKKKKEGDNKTTGS